MYWYWTRPRKIAASVVAVALVLVAVSYFFGSAILLRLGITTDVPAANQSVIYVDGWSMKNLGATPVYLSDQQYGGNRVELHFSPVNGDEVADLQAHAPGLLSDVASRMVSASSVLSCKASGCKDASGAISSDWFLNAGDIAGLGAEYRGYGISHTLYAAAIPGAVRQSMWLQYNNQQLSLVEPPAGLGATGANSSNGYNAHRWLVSAAFGQLFLPQAAWRGGVGGSLEVGALLSAPSATRGGDVAAVEAGKVFTAGLGAPSAQAAALSPSQLTFMSSPTTGCGPGVLCVPGMATKLGGQMRFSTSEWCSNGAVVNAILANGTWKYDFSVPTAQFGAWTQNPAGLAGSSGGDSWTWSGSPGLLQGTTTWNQDLVYMTASDPATLMGVGGQSGQTAAFVAHHHVSAASSAPWTAGTVIGNYFGGRWNSCKG